MGQERPAKRTPVTPEQVFLALGTAWHMLTGAPPDRKLLHILHAQSALETGHWKSIMNFNLGGAKRHGDYDWCYFTTTETWPTARAQSELASSKPGAEVSLVRRDEARGTMTLRYSGKQRMNCFASWETLDEAAQAHLGLLFRRYPKAIERARQGDATGYVRELKRGGYFTASEEDYNRIVTSIARRYTRQLEAVALPAVVML